MHLCVCPFVPVDMYNIMGDHFSSEAVKSTGSPLQLYIIKTGGLNQMGLDRLFCFQVREYRGEKMSDAGSSHAKQGIEGKESGYLRS